MSGIPRIAELIGRPFSPLYSSLMKAREALYRSGVFSSIKLDVPVISIGNLTMGGTGKTPTVMMVAKLMQEAGRKPAIISRGYGGNARKDINLVSDGKDILMDAHEAGDEPYLLARSLPGIPVVTGARRVLTGPYAVKELGADLIIMDDGFQHMALQRDLDIVLFKTPDLLGDGRVFPGGYLREPISALARADVFVITGYDDENADKVGEFTGYLKEMFPDRPVFKVGNSLGQPVNMEGSVVKELSSSNGYFAFCGLADPLSFKSSLDRAGYTISGFHAFPDHHIYTDSDIEMLAEKADDKPILTTEKDIVKLGGRGTDVPIYTVPLLIDSPGELEQYMQSFIKV